MTTPNQKMLTTTLAAAGGGSKLQWPDELELYVYNAKFNVSCVIKSAIESNHNVGIEL